MRYKMGKGEAFAFDAMLEKLLEDTKMELGYYPSYRQIGERCMPQRSVFHINRSLRRLAAAGKLSAEAMQVYNSKIYKKGVIDENRNKKIKSGTKK